MNNNDQPQRVINSRITDLRQLSPAERLAKVLEHSALAAAEVEYCSKAVSAHDDQSSLPIGVAEGMIENVIGKFELPLGIAANFVINDKDYLIPMAVEEPSVVAAASHMAKIARAHGGFVTSSDQPIMRAQIQVLGVTDMEGAKQRLLDQSQSLIDLANSKDAVLLSLGGGCKGIELHQFQDSPIGPMLVVHLLVDVRDAMGANTVNTMAELIAPQVEQISGGEVRLRILSNLADKRLATAEVRLPVSALATEQFSGEQVAQGIVEACALALVDPYRAATHNKGIMNGIDPIVLATGNDWRAVEAGAHAWAARQGRYTSLSDWRIDNQQYLVGRLQLPMALGLVGGATKTHPTAQAALAILGVETAQELAEVTAAVGLAQNMAALKALATEGIQKGHMALHARNIAVMAGAEGEDIDKVARILIREGNYSAQRAEQLMQVVE